MGKFKLGVMLESFRLPVGEALDRVRALHVDGVQVYATDGDMAPENMTPDKQAGFLHRLDDNGLVVSALCGDLGHGFGDQNLNPKLIEKSKRIIDLAKELGTNVVTTHIGVTPEDPAHPRYRVMQAACRELAVYAASLGAHFAVETGPETSKTLCAFLNSLCSDGMGVNMDPANLVMVTGDDPVATVRTLAPYIVHTHAKDGRRLKRKDPELIYGIVPDNHVVQDDEAFIELPLGEGDVPFPAYLNALRKIGYTGFLTVEREAGLHPEADIATAVDYLRREALNGGKL